MFLAYSVAGALVPLYSLRLQELGFSPMEIGWACATQALAGLVTPLMVGQVADRWLPTQRCLAACAFLAGILLWLLAELASPLAVFAMSLAFWSLMAPTLSLSATLSFIHLAYPELHYSKVRLWGTVGWVLPGWFLGYWFTDPPWATQILAGLRPQAAHGELADAFRLAGALALTLSCYALTLPHTPPSRHFESVLAPLAALKLLRSRAFAVYWVGVLGVCATVPFTTQVTPLFLSSLKIERQLISPILTIGQSMEIVSLALLPLLLLRLGIRGTMLIGLGAWAVDLGLLTWGRPVELVIGSQVLNGLCICCFLVAGQVFVNSRARDDVRASAQALVSFMTSLGMLIGNILVGWVRRQAHEQFMPTFATGATIALVLAVFFYWGFPTDESIFPFGRAANTPRTTKN
jgi:predicted MFS family arabinose efflux permease